MANNPGGWARSYFRRYLMRHCAYPAFAPVLAPELTRRPLYWDTPALREAATYRAPRLDILGKVEAKLSTTRDE